MEGFSTTWAIPETLQEITLYFLMPFMIFMVIDGCKIGCSQSISTGNQIDSSLAGIVLEGGQDMFFEMLDKYDRNSEAGGQCQGFLFYIFLILYGCYSWHLQDWLEPWEIMLISLFFPVNLGEPPSQRSKGLWF